MKSSYQRGRGSASTYDRKAGKAGGWPGRRTLTGSLGPQRPPSAAEPAGDDRAEEFIGRMERAFGVSFPDVSLRTDEEAQERAASLGARAYTDGAEIGFARGEFQPDTREGLHLIAHEFA